MNQVKVVEFNPRTLKIRDIYLTTPGFLKGNKGEWIKWTFSTTHPSPRGNAWYYEELS